MREQLEAWIEPTNDQGRLLESAKQLKALIEGWGSERCVNSEYKMV
jgi:hypothetical protein